MESPCGQRSWLTPSLLVQKDASAWVWLIAQTPPVPGGNSSRAWPSKDVLVAIRPDASDLDRHSLTQAGWAAEFIQW
jgi:hypothetical protein